MEKPNHERKSRGFREKLQQSAKNITSGERKAKSPKTPAQKRATRRKVWGVIGTICLVGVLTITIFVGIFMYYVNKTMKGSIEVPMSEYKPAVSTEMYYDKNAGTGEKEDWYMYQTLYMSRTASGSTSARSPITCSRRPLPSRTSASRATTAWTGTVPCALLSAP